MDAVYISTLKENFGGAVRVSQKELFYYADAGYLLSDKSITEKHLEFYISCMAGGSNLLNKQMTLVKQVDQLFSTIIIIKQ